MYHMLVASLVLALITLLATPLSIILDGVERKIKAIIQSRIGPPITQTLYDILKLTVKEVKPIHTIPYLVLYYVSCVTTLVSSIYLASYYVYSGSLISLVLSVALFSVSLTAFTTIPLLIPNPFSYIGGMRELILAIANESAFIIGIGLYVSLTSILQDKNPPLILGVTAISVLFFTLFLTSYSITGRPPFDIAEAEPELASGILIELSGSLLATYMLINLLKRYTSKFIVSALLTVLIFGFGLIPLAVSIIITVFLWIIYSLVSTLVGRSRIDLAPLTIGKIYILLYLLSITVLLVITYA